MGTRGLVDTIEGAANGFIIAMVIATFELQVMTAPATAFLRRQPLALYVLGRVLFYVAVFVAVLVGVGEISGGRGARNPAVLGRSLLFSFAMAGIFVVGIELRRLLGPGTLGALVTGRYVRPRVEERVVLMVDLKSSTAIAERLGPEGFLRVLDRFVFAATDPILEANGEIYRYVGDEIIVTWRADRAKAALACVLDIEEALKAVPALTGCRIAVHAGPLVVGELGDFKREIVMLGDTMNATARLEAMCRELGRDRLVSAEALALAALPPGTRAEPLGRHMLRGRETPIELFSLERGTSSPQRQ